ncbi:MAG: LCCL domain-containing protein [Gemmobacter sp.]|nr:LCCL domain-containing protein [Gemmobacter sp.]
MRKMLQVIVVAAAVAPWSGEALASEPECPRDFRGGVAPLTCRCPAEETRSGDVWGDGIYTADSKLCVAAVHAGAISAMGGVLTVIPEPGRELYSGTSRNGISTNDYGPYGASFRFEGIAIAEVQACPADLRNKDRVTALDCVCDATQTSRGDVWGSNPYTADSGLCRAAVHAGVIDRAGGKISLRVEGSRPGYRGSWRNGVTSLAYDGYDRSVIIEGATPTEFGELCPDRFTGFAGETEPLECLCTGEATQKGDAWGDRSYTSDSTICRAALHAGAAGPLGGKVIVRRAPPVEVYRARNETVSAPRIAPAWPSGSRLSRAPAR